MVTRPFPFLRRPTRMQTFGIAVLLGGLTLLMVSVFVDDGSDAELGERIIANLLKSEGKPCRIADAAPFPWDDMHLFPPYTPAELMERKLGFPWPDAARVDLQHEEGAVVLAFVREFRVVRYARIRRHRADFAPSLPGVPWRYTRSAAVFKTRAGKSWTYVDPVPLPTGG